MFPGNGYNMRTSTSTTFQVLHTNYGYVLKYLFNTHSLEESLSFTNYEMDLQRTHVSRVNIYEYGCHSILSKQAYKKNKFNMFHILIQDVWYVSLSHII